MENIIKDVADRIRETRLVCEISEEEMAQCTDVSLETYRELEAGNADFSFTFIYKCAARLGVDTTDLLKGSSPTLKSYSITRAGGGLPIARRKGFRYNNLAPLFKNKIAEPFIVRAKCSLEEMSAPIKLSHHEGQEYDYVLSGQLKVVVDGHTELLRNFLRCRISAVFVKQLTAGFFYFIYGFHHMNRNSYGSRLIGNGSGNRLPYPPGSIG